jgi:glycosyltransferase involved in cell wall biosynthesis
LAKRRVVLQVLPHPGGGGETYLNVLGSMDGYRFERVYLAPSAKPAGAWASILRKAVQIQWSVRAHDILHVHGEVASALCLPSLAMRPSVVTLHGLNLLRRLQGPGKTVAQVNLRLIVRAASTTICVSQTEYDEVLASGAVRGHRRPVVIHNGVARLAAPNADQRAAVRAELGVPLDSTVGVSVGSLDEHKDPLVAVRAAIEVTRDGGTLTLLVAGDGPLRPELERLAGEGEGGAVHVLGFRPDVGRLLAAADFFVLSSRREGFSFSLLEAMSLGLPAVVSNAPGNAEAVGDTGIVVRYGDVRGFAAAFRRLLSEPERVALGRRARERVRQNFSAEEMVQRTRHAYDEVLGLRGLKSGRDQAEL